jgi:ATP adenylyltransferase/5',5'''-P-1,P-4-tetraphosphate phosphorylase II
MKNERALEIDRRANVRPSSEKLNFTKHLVGLWRDLEDNQRDNLSTARRESSSSTPKEQSVMRRITSVANTSHLCILNKYEEDMCNTSCRAAVAICGV